MKPDENPRNVEEMIIPLEKKRKNIKRIKTSIIIKMEHYKVSNLLDDSTVTKKMDQSKWFKV